jgi:hypothetical protein
MKFVLTDGPLYMAGTEVDLDDGTTVYHLLKSARPEMNVYMTWVKTVEQMDGQGRIPLKYSGMLSVARP